MPSSSSAEEGKGIIRATLPPFLLLALLVLFALVATAVPEGPDAAYVETRNRTLADNYTINDSDSRAGGNIYVYNLTGTQTNYRWKGYVGNVTGVLRLADSMGVLYEWSLGTDFTAEVYATRTGNSITWGSINCTWFKTADGSTSNRSMEEEENSAMSFTTSNDNISATFDARDNIEFYVGNIFIAQDTCYTTNPYSSSSSNSNRFDEVLLHDGTYMVYTAIVNKSETGYSGEIFDYEMILPENADPGWTLSTAYYFYLELA